MVLPSASPGIFAAIMIGFGRAVGETMIVLMATGNTPILDWSLFNGMRTLSANIAVEIPEAPHGGTLYRVLFLSRSDPVPHDLRPEHRGRTGAPAPAQEIRTVLRGLHEKVLATRRTLVWATGAALAVTLLIAAGAGGRGPGQRPGRLLAATAEPSSPCTTARKVLGEVIKREADPRQRRRCACQFKIGNRDLYGLDFRWVDEADIVATAASGRTRSCSSAPEYGNFFGILAEPRTSADLRRPCGQARRVAALAGGRRRRSQAVNAAGAELGRRASPILELPGWRPAAPARLRHGRRRRGSRPGPQLEREPGDPRRTTSSTWSARKQSQPEPALRYKP